MKGVVQDLTIEVIPQSPFLSLSTALFDAVAHLNCQNIYPSKEKLYLYLGKHYPEVKTPDRSVIHDCLGRLIKERRLYHNGRGYFVLNNEHILNEVISGKSSVNPHISENESGTMKEFVLESSFNSSCSPTDNDSKQITSDCRSQVSNNSIAFHLSSMANPVRGSSTHHPSSRGVSSKRLKSEMRKEVSNGEKVNCDATDCRFISNFHMQNPTKVLDSKVSNENSKNERPKIQRSHSFSGYETDKSLKASVSFALVGQPAVTKNDHQIFKRTHSFGVGSLKRSKCEQYEVVLSTGFEQTDDILLGSKEIFDENMNYELASQLFDNKSSDMRPFDVLNHYNDLGSCLSLTTKMGLSAYNASDFFPPLKAESLAEELKIAYKGSLNVVNSNGTDSVVLYACKENIEPCHKADGPANEDPTLVASRYSKCHETNSDLTSDCEIKRILLSPRSRKKIGGQPYESQYCTIKLNTPGNSATKSAGHMGEKESINDRADKEEKSRLYVNDNAEPIIVRMRSRTIDEKRRTQKERNSMLFEEKRSSLKIMGMV